MTSLLMTSQIRFGVLRRAENTWMRIFLSYIGSTHIGQSIYNTSKIFNRETQLQFEKGGSSFLC